MVKKLEIGNLNPLKRYFAFDLNTNSKIYRQNGILYKVPRRFTEDLDYVLENLKKKKMNHVVQIKDIYTKNNKNYAYSMRYYSGYKSIRRFRSRDTKLKLEDCKRIIKTFRDLGSRNMIYYDFHKGNVLLREDTNNIVICDIDGLEKCRKKEDKKKQLLDAVCLCAAYLYNVDFPEMKAYIKSKRKVDEKGIFLSCYESVGTKDFFKNVERLSQIDPQDVQNNKRRIRQESKEEYKEHFDYYRKF